MTTPFGFSSTADDVLAGVDLAGKRAIVTGASSGIGVETARALAAAGADVTLTVRRPEAAERIGAKAALLDLADLDSVAAFVDAWTGPLDILVNNAGIMAVPALQRTPQGHELQFGTNFLGHFALTTGLRAAFTEDARIVSLSSNAHFLSPVVYDDPDYAERPYDPWSAYGQSKTACIHLAVEVARRWGLTANACNPGAIATGLQKHTGGLQTPEEKRKTVPQGAATSVLLAASPLLDGVRGRYYEDCNESAITAEPVLFGGGVAPYALDPGDAEKTWELAATATRR